MIDEKSQKCLERQECVTDGQMYSQVIAESLRCYGNVNSKMYFSSYGMRKMWGLRCVISGSLGSTHDYLSFRYIKGFSQFKVIGQQSRLHHRKFRRTTRSKMFLL